jgi:uncharacterized protein YkwD
MPRTDWIRTTHVPRRAVLAVGVAAVGAAVLMGSATSADAIDPWNRVSVANAYLNTLRAAESSPTAWSGSTASCTAGAPTRRTQAATLAAVNFYRGLGGLNSVRLDAALSAKAQRAALMMDANTSLSHTPPTSWRCSSASGRAAAANSNIALGLSGARAVSGYMSDFGAGNGAVGHRRWIMFPATRAMGSGSTTRANALWVVPTTTAPPTGTPAWVSWPTPGYVPYAIEPNGRWSLSATNSKISFRTAKVTVHDALGRSLTVYRHPVHVGYGNNTLAWEVSGLKRPVGTASAQYTVRVTGIRRAGASTPVTRAYTVRLFDADAVARVHPTQVPSMTGRVRAGSTLTASRGSWSAAPTSYRFQWLRNGVAIPGATLRTYRLTTSDRHQWITVRVTAHRYGRVDGVSAPRSQQVP